MTRFMTLALVLCLPVIVAGCGGAAAPEAEVNGKLELNGKPVSKALVQFVPKDTKSTTVYSAITNDQGEFHLEVFEVGNFVARFTKMVNAEGKVPQPKDQDDPEVAAEIQPEIENLTNALPEIYSAGVPVEITKGNNDLPVFKLVH